MLINSGSYLSIKAILSCCMYVCMHSQLTDALKKKFTKCDHIDVDWGVGDGGEEEIYQTPIIEGQPNSVVPAPSSGGTEGTLRKSETVGSFQDERNKGEGG